MFGILVVLVTNVFRHLETGIQSNRFALSPWYREDTGILYCHFFFQSPVIDPAKLLDKMHVFRMRRARKVIPGFVKKTDRVDHEPFAFPMCSGISVESGLQIFRMIRTIEEELAVHVRIA